MGAPYAFFDNIITLRSGINPGVTTRKSFRFGVDRGGTPRAENRGSRDRENLAADDADDIDFH